MNLPRLLFLAALAWIAWRLSQRWRLRIEPRDEGLHRPPHGDGIPHPTETSRAPFNPQRGNPNSKPKAQQEIVLRACTSCGVRVPAPSLNAAGHCPQCAR